MSRGFFLQELRPTDTELSYNFELRSTGFRTDATIREMHAMSYAYIVVIRLRLFDDILYE